MTSTNRRAHSRASATEAAPRGLLRGDCLELLRELPDNSVDAVITDPPYELGFMGKAWDSSGIAYNVELWSECLRVLKPGGHLLAFGGTRTYHRMACAIEDAGFEIRDSIHWTYASGMPHSLNVAKAMDKTAGFLEAEGQRFSTAGRGGERLPACPSKGYVPPEPKSAEAKRWAGWGTNLKPTHEPIVVARKLLEGSVVANVLAYGTGALNIDAGRVAFSGEDDERESKTKNRHADFGTEPGGNTIYGDYSMVERTNYDAPARWPSNTIVTHHPECRRVGTAEENFEVNAGFTGERQAEGWGTRRPVTKRTTAAVPVWECVEGCPTGELGDAARFFTQANFSEADWPRTLYFPKASPRERNAGLEHLPVRRPDTRSKAAMGMFAEKGVQPQRNAHPTVKPVALMRHLIRLTTPPDGIVLDPFIGSGTTAVAAILEGFDWVGCEMTAEYWPIIEARVTWAEGEAAGQRASGPRRPRSRAQR